MFAKLRFLEHLRDEGIEIVDGDTNNNDHDLLEQEILLV